MFRSRRLPILAVAAALGLVSVTVPGASGEPAPGASTAPVVADAFVRSGDHADTNYGSHSQLQWKAGSTGFARESFITFDTSALTQVENATLWLHGRVSGGSSDEYPDSVPTHVYAVDPGWDEATLTWNNKPELPADAATEFTLDVPEGQPNGWHAVDLTQLVMDTVEADAELLSIALVRYQSSGPLPQMGSRESGYGPVLEINGQPVVDDPAPHTELVATADALVRDGQYADDTYGATNLLQWKVGGNGFSRESFARFELNDLTDGDIETASLRLFGRVSGGNADDWPETTDNLVHRVVGDWSEDTITWNTRPEVEAEPLAAFVIGGESDQANRWHLVDITDVLREAVANGHETLDLRFSRAVATGPIVQMHSRENSNPPVIVVNEVVEEPEPPITGPVRSALYPEGWEPGLTDDQGRFLHDFSYAGYRYGADVPTSVPGPVLDVTHPRFGADPTGQTDSTLAIQATIDAVGAAGGGTVHLPAGLYTVSPQDDSRAVLHIPYDGVLLRGEGPDHTRIQTSTAQGMRQSAVILVGPEKAAWQSWHTSEDEQDRPAVPLTRDVVEPTRTLHVADTEPFAVGDWVILKADTTQEWLDEHPVLPGQQWTPTTFRALVYHRQITAVDAEAGTVEIDIPTRYRMLLRDGLRLHHHHSPTLGSGVADLAVGMRQSDLPHVDGNEHNTEGTQGWEAHGAAAVSFNNAVDSWVDNVASFRPGANPDDVHVLSGGVYIWYARSITVTDGDFRNAQYLGAGGNGYHYHVMGSDNLVRDSYAEKGRHNYLVQAVQGTGNVILDSHSVDATHALELHRHLGVANLFDNVSVDRDTFEMQYRTSSTHAHSGTESVMWNISGENCTRGRLAVSQQFGWGYVIGTTGEGACAVVENPGGQFTEPRDWLEFIGAGEHLVPRSLYLDQLERRTQRSAVDPHGALAQLADALTSAVASGEVAGPIASQLEAAVHQARRHLDTGRTAQAGQALERFVGHLDNPKPPDTLSARSRIDLRERAEHVIGQLGD